MIETKEEKLSIHWERHIDYLSKLRKLNTSERIVLHSGIETGVKQFKSAVINALQQKKQRNGDMVNEFHNDFLNDIIQIIESVKPVNI